MPSRRRPRGVRPTTTKPERTSNPGQASNEAAGGVGDSQKKTWADVAMSKPVTTTRTSTFATSATSSGPSRGEGAKPYPESTRRGRGNSNRGGRGADQGGQKGNRKTTPTKRQDRETPKPQAVVTSLPAPPDSLFAGLTEFPFLEDSPLSKQPEQWSSAHLFPLSSVDLPLDQLRQQEQQPLPITEAGSVAGFEPKDYIGLACSRRGSSSDESTVSLSGLPDANWAEPLVSNHRIRDIWGTPKPQAAGTSDWSPWTSGFNGFPDAFTLNNVPEFQGLSHGFKSRYQDLATMQHSFSSQDTGNVETLLHQVPVSPSPSKRILSKVKAIAGKPAVFVVPLRLVNFASLYIQFSVQVFNIPRIPLNQVMLEAVAESPSGVQIPGQIKMEVTKPCPEIFQGSFKATHEVGIYNLRVRLVLPFNLKFFGAQTPLFSDFGVIGDAVNVLVSRNYFRESQHVPSILINLPLEVHERLPDGRPITNSKAWGLACDKETNRIYYSERAAHRVTCVDPATGSILFRLKQNSTVGKLNRPTGVCCDQRNRRIIVCDKDNHRVSFFSMDGEYISSFGDPGYQNGMFSYPWDVDINLHGNRIVVADSRNKRLQLFDQFGNFLSKYSIFETNPFEYKTSFDYPRGISFNADGKLVYVTDFNTHNIIEVPITFTSFRRLCPEGKLKRPQGIVADQFGLVVADSRNNVLRHVTQDGKLLSSISHCGTYQIIYPVNLTLLRNDYVATLDGNGKLHIF